MDNQAAGRHGQGECLSPSRGWDAKHRQRPPTVRSQKISASEIGGKSEHMDVKSEIRASFSNTKLDHYLRVEARECLKFNEREGVALSP